MISLAQGQPLSPEAPCFPAVPDHLQAWTVQNPLGPSGQWVPAATGAEGYGGAAAPLKITRILQGRAEQGLPEPAMCIHLAGGAGLGRGFGYMP